MVYSKEEKSKKQQATFTLLHEPPWTWQIPGSHYIRQENLRSANTVEGTPALRVVHQPDRLVMPILTVNKRNYIDWCQALNIGAAATADMPLKICSLKEVHGEKNFPFKWSLCNCKGDQLCTE